MAREYQATIRPKMGPLRTILFGTDMPGEALRESLRASYAQVDEAVIFQQRDVTNWTPIYQSEADDA